MTAEIGRQPGLVYTRAKGTAWLGTRDENEQPGWLRRSAGDLTEALLRALRWHARKRKKGRKRVLAGILFFAQSSRRGGETRGS